MIEIVMVLLSFPALAIAATLWGFDSRDRIGDDHQRPVGARDQRRPSSGRPGRPLPVLRGRPAGTGVVAADPR